MTFQQRNSKKIPTGISGIKNGNEFRFRWGSQKSEPKIGIPNQDHQFPYSCGDWHGPRMHRASMTFKTLYAYGDHASHLMHMGIFQSLTFTYGHCMHMGIWSPDLHMQKFAYGDPCGSPFAYGDLSLKKCIWGTLCKW